MAAADSVLLGPLTANWQNVWDLAAAKYAADGIPMFEKFARTVNLEASTANDAAVEWSRTSIGNNPAGSLNPGESIAKNSGNHLVNESTYNLYVRGNGQLVMLERTQ